MKEIKKKLLLNLKTFLHLLWIRKGYFEDSKEIIKLFTRRLEDVTKQFPDIVKAVKKITTKKSIILDCEAIGFDKKTKTYLPFQNISQRIKRKYDIEEMADKYPIELNVFDILLYNDETLLHKPLKDRQKILKKLLKS